MGIKIGIIEGLYITIVSMLVVFSILILISLILSSFKNIFKGVKDQVKKDELAMTNEEDEVEKIVVALVASIMAGGGKVNPNLHIKSITRLR